ncbi:sensor histidine kinase [Geodermatophilus sp. SYSU D00691]
MLAVYWLLVLGGGALLGSRPPNVPLAVLATAVVAVTFEPLRRALSRRWTISPYDALAEFTQQVTGLVATDQLAPRMARLLAEATSASRVEVWLQGDGSAGEDLAARWPADADPIPLNAPATHRHEIRQAGEVIGHVVREPTRPADPLSPVEQRLLGDLLASAGLALRNLTLRTGLQRHIEETVERSVELQASRQRIVATADATRRRLERDIHDGAQQHLVALTVSLGLAATVGAHDPPRAASLVRELRPAAEIALATLELLSRGIYPQLLAESGMAAALEAAWSTSPVPVHLADETRRRFPAEVESAAYFCCLEAVQNAVKHAQPTRVDVRLSARPGELRLEVVDDGAGFDDAVVADGSGLAGMRDRIESLAGTLTVDSRPGSGTRLTGCIPVLRRVVPDGRGG